MPPDAKTDEAIRRVSGSDLFRQSPRLRDLLVFLAASESAGESLKESLIGVQFFGRPPNYDPKLDPTVRTEVRRLRMKLNEYYATEGASDTVRVSIPKGRYRLELTPATVPVIAQSRRRFHTGRMIPILAGLLAISAVAIVAWRTTTHAASASMQRTYAAHGPAVQELYLQGRQLWRTRQEPKVRKAIQLFEQCTRKEPDYVWPYVALSDSYAMLAANSQAKPSEVLPKAESAALRAIELAPDLADVHISLGYIRYCQWDWFNAEKEYAKARRLNPALSLAFFRSAVVAMAFGRFNDALSYLHDAQVLDPFSPLIQGAISETYYYMRDYRRAAEAARKLAPMDALASHFFLAKAEWRLGEMKDAAAEWKHVAAAPCSPFEFRLRTVLTNRDNPAKARALLRDVLKDPGPDVSPWQLAEVSATFQEKEAAWKWLGQAVQIRQPDVVSVQWDPAFDGMRSEPRYGKLLAQIGLPPAPQSTATASLLSK